MNFAAKLLKFFYLSELFSIFNTKIDIFFHNNKFFFPENSLLPDYFSHVSITYLCQF